MATDLKSETTTIQVTTRTRDRLAKLGAKNDTYDDILERILNDIENKK